MIFHHFLDYFSALSRRGIIDVIVEGQPAVPAALGVHVVPDPSPGFHGARIAGNEGARVGTPSGRMAHPFTEGTPVTSLLFLLAIHETILTGSHRSFTVLGTFLHSTLNFPCQHPVRGLLIESFHQIMSGSVLFTVLDIQTLAQFPCLLVLHGVTHDNSLFLHDGILARVI